MVSIKNTVYNFFAGNGNDDVNLLFIHGSGCNKKFFQ